MESINKAETKVTFEFKIAGNVCAEFWNIVKGKNIDHMINYIGYLNHTEVVEHYTTANFLLQIVDDVSDNHLFVAGKLFDYMGSKKPILAIGPKEGEVEEIILDTDSGFFFDYSESDQLLQQLLKILNLEIDVQKIFSFKGVEKYSRHELTKKLALIFDRSNNNKSE